MSAPSTPTRAAQKRNTATAQSAARHSAPTAPKSPQQSQKSSIQVAVPNGKPKSSKAAAQDIVFGDFAPEEQTALQQTTTSSLQLSEGLKNTMASVSAATKPSADGAVAVAASATAPRAAPKSWAALLKPKSETTESSDSIVAEAAEEPPAVAADETPAAPEAAPQRVATDAPIGSTSPRFQIGLNVKASDIDSNRVMSTSTAAPVTATSSKQKKKEKGGSGKPVSTEHYELEGTNLLSDFRINLDSEQKVMIRPRGLQNVNNSCYLNSVLQALLYTPLFYNLFSEKLANMQLDMRTYPLTKKIIRFTKEFQSLSTSAAAAFEQERFGAPFVPRYILDYMKGVDSSLLMHGSQHDAHEFLAFLLDRLHEELAVTRDGTRQFEGLSDEGWEEVGSRGKASKLQEIKFKQSAISQIFGGNLRSIFKKRGAKESLTLQPFYSLQLPMNEDHLQTLEQCLEAITEKEMIEGAGVGAYKQISIESLPRVLVFQLQRFVFDNYSVIGRKILRKIEFNSNLRINTRVMPAIKIANENESDVRRNYALTAVIMHHGQDATGGHYSSYVKHGCGRWMHINDSKIELVSLEQVLAAQAYVLVYQQQNQ